MQQSQSIADPSAIALAGPRPRTRTQRILRVLARKRLFTFSIILLSVMAGASAAARSGYVLTLQAREQFIRRERATSNFSTGQALLALAFTITVQTLGPQGLRESAELCYQRAHDAARRIAAVPGFAVVERGPWFQEFLVRGPLAPAELARELAQRGITSGLDVSMRTEPEAREATLFCVTEATAPEHVDALVEALRESGARP